MHPELEFNFNERGIERDFHVGKFQIPKWADLRNILITGHTTGRITQGVHPGKIARLMLDNMLADDPIRSAVEGGYEVITPWHRVPYVNSMHLELYEALKTCIRDSYRLFKKRDLEHDPPCNLKDGSGIKFLEKIQEIDQIPDILEDDDIEEAPNIEIPQPLQDIVYLADDDIDDVDIDESMSNIGDDGVGSFDLDWDEIPARREETSLYEDSLSHTSDGNDDSW